MRSIRAFPCVVALVATFLIVSSSARAQTPAPAPAPTQEMVANPQYTSWAKHKPGTKVSLQSQTSVQGMNLTQNLTQTLTEVTPDKAVVEITMTMDLGGQEHETKQKQDVPAKVAKGNEYIPPEMKGSAKEVGKEKVTIGGKAYDCKVVEFTGENAQGKASGKLWSTEEIPGSMAKTEVNMTAPQAATMTMQVTGVELK